MDALNSLVRSGKVRYIGCSNLAAWQMIKANSIASSRNEATFCSLQAYYSLLGRDLELDLLPACEYEGVGVMVWSPLAGGFITGKYRREQELPEGSRRSHFDFPPIDKEKGFDLIESLDILAKEKNTTIPRLAISWLLQQKGITSVIVGAKKMTQLEDNLAATQITWTDEDMKLLQQVTTVPQVYPNWMLSRMART